MPAASTSPQPSAGALDPSPRADEHAAPLTPTPIRSILLPLDGSPLSEQAVPIALAIARASGARVRAVHLFVPLPKGAHVPGLFTELDALEGELAAASRSYAEQVQRRLAAEWGPAASVDVMQASRPPRVLRESPSVVDALLDAADDYRADLIVMTTHGLGGLSRVWLGSTVDGLIRRSRVPLLVIRPSPDERAAPRGLPAHILVPLDGSELGDRILGDVLALARLAGARVTLLTVLVPRLAIVRPAPVTRVDEADLARQRLEAEQRLDGVAARLREQGVAAEALVVVDQHAVSAILEHAAALAADVIAMATHGRGGVRRLMLGSVTDKVLRASRIPLLVRHPDPAGGQPAGE